MKPIPFVVNRKYNVFFVAKFKYNVASMYNVVSALILSFLNEPFSRQLYSCNDLVNPYHYYCQHGYV